MRMSRRGRWSWVSSLQPPVLISRWRFIRSVFAVAVFINSSRRAVTWGAKERKTVIMRWNPLCCMRSALHYHHNCRRKWMLLVSQDKLKLLMLQNISISNKCCSFLFIKEFWKIKCLTVFTKIWTVSSIENNQKCFLSSKSVYYYDFWRSCDWSNDVVQLCITEINVILTHIHTENSYFKCY